MADRKAQTMPGKESPAKDSSKNLQVPRRSTTPQSQLKMRDTKGVRPKSTAPNANKKGGASRTQNTLARLMQT